MNRSRWRRYAPTAVALLATAAAGTFRATHSGWAPPREPVSVSSASLKDVAVAAPEVAPIGLAALVSDATDPRERDLAERLRARGFIVLRLDLAAWRAALERGAGACIRPIVDVELLGKEAQRALGVTRFLRPVVVGIGAGGAMTQAILSRALPATLGGGVALDPDASVPGAKPICDDNAPVAPPVPADGGASYPLPAHMQAALTIVSGEAGSSGTAPGYGTHAPERIVEPDPARRLAAAVDAAARIAVQDTGSGGLPVVDLPARGKARALALFVSGDGGWRDIDKQIGEQLTQDGIHVVGLDALRYFWSARDPQATAADLARMIREADPAGELPVLVLGYSFGADLFPFSWPFWPEALKARTRLIALLGPNRSTGFSVTVTGWLGYGGEHAVVPRIAAMPLERVLCVYGAAETNPACTDPSLAAARRIRLEGGHHFDRDYPAIARLILKEAGLSATTDAELSPKPRGTP